MLHRLTIEGVGPAQRAHFDFGERLNLITGDNGLGKSFILDVAWWALTRTWPGNPAWPGAGRSASIGFAYDARTTLYESEAVFDGGRWSRDRGRPPIPGMVIFADADGGFSVWDPERNYQKKEADTERPAAFIFDREQVWRGLQSEEGQPLCNGLISDWVLWQLEAGEAFEQLERVLESLSEGPPVPALAPGPPGRLAQPDTTRYPTLMMPYGEAVPIVHASAGVRRVVTLAYLLVWAWQEHQLACQQNGTRPVGRVIFLIDELESHLHPRWQRALLPALLEVMDALTGAHQVDVQIVAATHSPMVLASVEPRFDAERDRIWSLELVEQATGDGVKRVVEVQPFDWSPRGDANGWLTSELFDLGQPRSREAEDALKQMAEVMRQAAPSSEAVREADLALRRARLRDTDPLGARWAWFLRTHGLAE